MLRWAMARLADFSIAHTMAGVAVLLGEPTLTLPQPMALYGIGVPGHVRRPDFCVFDMLALEWGLQEYQEKKAEENI